MSGFEELELWKEARELRNEISKMTKAIPAIERFRLSDQLTRASRSVTANIAEGHGRFHYQENIQFCRQARGSLSELLDHLICALDEGFIDQAKMDRFRERYSRCLKLLNGYILYLKNKKAEE